MFCDHPNRYYGIQGMGKGFRERKGWPKPWDSAWKQPLGLSWRTLSALAINEQVDNLYWTQHRMLLLSQQGPATVSHETQFAWDSRGSGLLIQCQFSLLYILVWIRIDAFKRSSTAARKSHFFFILNLPSLSYVCI